MTATMINKEFNYVVIGASNDEEKYGHKVTLFLKENGYSVIPVNPNEKVILDLPVSATLEDVRAEVDVVIFVVPPTVTELLLETVKDEGITRVWFQPGSESDKAIAFCEDNNIEYTAGACIMTTQN